MEKRSLAGLWRASLTHAGDTPPETFETEMALPGTTALAGLGKENDRKETGFLTERFPFSGRLWLEKTIETHGWADKTVLLELERTRLTRVFLDGRPVGGGDSLCTPHVIPLPPLSDGAHTLALRVDNTGYPIPGGHMTSPDTQTNWTGVTGALCLTAGRTVLTQPRVCFSGQEMTVVCRVYGDRAVPFSLRIEGRDEAVQGQVRGDTVRFSLTLPDGVPLWDEEDPAIFSVTLTGGEDTLSFRTGARTLARRGRALLVNGREIFLRGTHHGLQFPLTGCAPWDKASWRKVLQTAKDYGLNHIRFHTSCPPQAAFEAADEMGMYLSPELPFWGTVPSDDEAEDGGRLTGYLLEEGLRILRAFGSHPSFFCLSLGNELWGSREKLAQMIRALRREDPGRLYSAGANNFQFSPARQPEEDLFVGVRLGTNRLLRGSYASCDGPLGRVQTDIPSTDWDYDAAVTGAEESGAGGGTVRVQRGTQVAEVAAGKAEAYVPDIPVITHEVGQYEVYPDFSEIPDYTGVLAPRNLEAIRDRMREKGLLPMAPRYRRASGALAAFCYRMDIEAALRSRELSGFQLLDLADYMGQGTALVGMLDGLMHSKGLIAPEKWRAFCGDPAVLARFPKFVYAGGEEICFRAAVSDTRKGVRHESVRCELAGKNGVIEAFTLPLREDGGRLRESLPARFAPVSLSAPERLTARFSLPDGMENRYDLWVFPSIQVTIGKEGIRTEKGRVPFRRADEQAEGPCVCVPDAAGKLPAEYCVDFWCYPMFKSISESMGKPVASGTMGLLIDPEDPLLARFPAQEHTTPPWYPLLRHAHAEPVAAQSGLTAELIDHWARMERFGILWREGDRVYTTIRLWELPDEPAARWFAFSVAEALLSGVLSKDKEAL